MDIPTSCAASERTQSFHYFHIKVMTTKRSTAGICFMPAAFLPMNACQRTQNFQELWEQSFTFSFLSFFFPVPNKFVQVRSILTLQIHSAHIPAQSLKQSEKGNGAEEF